jgi:hypothetical protein
VFKDADECYQAIGRALVAAAKTDWNKIVAAITLDGERVDAVVACWDKGHEAPSSYLTGVPMLARYFYELARLVSTDEKGLFKKCTFTLYSDGKYNTNFVY